MAVVITWCVMFSRVGPAVVRVDEGGGPLSVEQCFEWRLL